MAAAFLGCTPRDDGAITISGSALGAEAELLRSQIARYMAMHPDRRVQVRVTPDAADQRHQLYVQWLNARATAPDILQLDVIWTAEFAAAGWILPLDRFQPPVDSFFQAGITANRWRDSIFALPWFIDVGMLYWRTDLMAMPPTTFDDLRNAASAALRNDDVRYGFVWQGSRYEGLITGFVEMLGAHGGEILDERGRVAVGDANAVRALTAMRDAIRGTGISPEAVLTWQEEQTRFAFQNGEAAFMRNWPYAYPLMQDSAKSRVAGRFGVTPMPAAPGGAPTAALGGGQLAINAHSRHPGEAYHLVAFLLAPEQMLERARVVGQYPSRRDLYDSPALAAALPIPPADARRIIEAATPRPVTPVYTQLSEILQIHLHRALTRQAEPADALADAAREMEALLDRTGLLEREAGDDGR
jgi:multiple sugar transport system substrate-binding protein